LAKQAYNPNLGSTAKTAAAQEAAVIKEQRPTPQQSQSASPVAGAQQVSVNGQVFWATKLPNGKWKRVQ
jgi:hypothetical protein